MNNIDWSNIPEKYNWIAQDRGGHCYAYQSKPILGDCYWWVDNYKNNYTLLEKNINTTGIVCSSLWETSLIQRPVKISVGSTEIDWEQVPDVYFYVAKDEDGLVYCYQSKPSIDIGGWSHIGAPCMSLDSYLIPNSVDWKESLCIRPKQELSALTVIHNQEVLTPHYYTAEQLEAFFLYFNDDITLAHVNNFLFNEYKKKERDAVVLLEGLGYSVEKTK